MDFMPYGWAVEFGKDLKAWFDDHTKALNFAAKSHGVLREVFVPVTTQDQALLGASQIKASRPAD